VGDSVGEFSYGQHDASWLGFYNYFQEVLDVDDVGKLEPMMKSAENCNWFLPYKDVCFCSDKLEELHMVDGKLHHDGGPSWRYRDGFCGWNLNGVRVPQEIAETPFDQLDPQMVVKETNVEVRRELLRKIGIERFVEKIGAKTLDAKGDYELLSIEVGLEQPAIGLKMKNPSIGVYHVEFVPNEIGTVEQALNWRNQSEEQPAVLT
jgi:hypothetical protein